MKRSTMFRLLLLLIFLPFASISNAQSLGPAPGKFYTIQKEYDESQIDGYNLYVPTNSGNAVVPVIIFLQGGLGVGDEVDKIFNWGLPKMLKEGRTGKDELDELMLSTFIYIMPHIRSGQFYSNEKAITQIIQEVGTNYNIDERRIYLTGLSRGGHGTWGLASRMPDTFAAIVPICGGQHGVASYEALTHIPIWTAHNPDDNVVGYSETEEAVVRIERISGKKFSRSHSIATSKYQNSERIFTSSDNKAKPHDAWTEMYTNANFYKWLLRFSKA